MAQEHGMIEPFEPGQIRQVDGRKVISWRYQQLRRHSLRLRARAYSPPTSTAPWSIPKNFDEKSFVDFNDDVHHPAQQLCPGPHHGVLPHSAQRSPSAAST